MRAKPPFAVLWDLDGVLVDTSGYHYESWRRSLAEIHRELSEEEFRATFGLRGTEILARLLPGVPEPERERLAERKEAYFRGLLPERIPVAPGVERLVMDLASARIPQAVASSAPRANLEEILPRLHLPLAEYVAAEDVAEGKPNPEVFLKAAQRLGMPSDRCVVVEDSLAGVQAARRARMACLAVAVTWPREKLSGADMVVDSLEQVSVEDLRRLVEIRHKTQGTRHKG